MRTRIPNASELCILKEWYLRDLGQKRTIEELKAAVASHRDVLRVVTVANEVHGFVHAVWSGGPYELLALVVAPEKRGHGLGTFCIRDLLAHLAGMKGHELWLEVRSDNLSARQLYLKTGAKETGMRRNYYGQGVDAILMTYSAEAVLSSSAIEERGAGG